MRIRLYFLSQEGFIESVGGNDGEYNRGMCLACFDNDYPTPVDRRIGEELQLLIAKV